MFDRKLIGRESEVIVNTVEKGAIQKFTESIGEQNPLFYDEEYARGTRYGGIIAPPTFCRTFNFGEIPGLDRHRKFMVHGEQKYTYFKPLRPGDIVYCKSCLTDIQEKEGKSGRMVFIELEQEGRDASGELYFSSRRVGVIRMAAVERDASRKKSIEPVASARPEFKAVPGPKFNQVEVGDLIGPLEMPPVTRVQLVKYAGASGDFNPIHTVEDVAQEMGLNGVIAHGMLTMALLGRMITNWMGLEGNLVNWGVRFSAMVRPGDVITCRGVITGKDPEGNGGVVNCEAWGENQRGQKVIGGHASVRLA